MNDVTKDDLWSFNNLKKLTEEQLIDRLTQVDNQATLIRWRILAELRSRFPSDKLFGKYVATQEIFTSKSSSAIYHECNAGRWCINNKVIDLNRLGIKKSVVYMLASPKNKDISNKLFIKLKNQHYSISEVEKIIEQERSITIEKEAEIQESELITYHEHVEPYTIPVVNGIAIEQKQLPAIDVQPLLQNHVSTYIEHVEEYEENKNVEYETYVVTKKLTEDEMILRIIKLVDSFGCTPLVSMRMLIEAKNQISNRTYGKKIA
jgi:hypothetical protein